MIISESERARRQKLNKQKWIELKRYIPFLVYLSKNVVDPVMKKKVVQLFEWINKGTTFSVRLGNQCEQHIQRWYTKYKIEMILPSNIVSIFEDDTIVISDDESEVHLSTPGESKRNATEVPEISKPAPTNDDSIAALDSNLIDKTPSPEPVLVNDKQELNTNKEICTERKLERAPSEEGEILSENDEPQNQAKSKLSVESNTLSEDEIINQELFRKIDNLANESANSSDLDNLSAKGSEKSGEGFKLQKSPILRQKNPDEVQVQSKSPVLPPSNIFSPISDNESDIVPYRKKKKKHKHRRKNRDSSVDWYISELENHLEKYDSIKQKILRRDPSSSHETDKNEKKRKKKKRQFKPLCISDDDDEELAVSITCKDECQLKVSNSEDTKEEKITIQDADKMPSTSPLTVILTDSDEDKNTSETVIVELSEEVRKSENIPMILTKSGRKYELSPERTRPKEDDRPLNVENTSETTACDKPSIISPATEMTQNETVSSCNEKAPKDLSNLSLDQLNDIYSQLCVKTGVQLEELLSDFFSSNSKPTELSKESVEKVSEQQNNLINEATQYSVPEIHHSDPLESDQLKKSHDQQQLIQQMHKDLWEQQMLNKNMQQMMQHQMMQQQQMMYFSNTMPCVQMPTPRDPRIQKALEQINILRNYSYRQPDKVHIQNQTRIVPTTKAPLPVLVTSKTARTYGEHKRLRELEKQGKLLKEQEKSEKAKQTNQVSQPEGVKENEEIEKSPKTRCEKEHSSSSESVPNAPKSPVPSKMACERKQVSNSGSNENCHNTAVEKDVIHKKRDRKQSHSSESGQKSLKPSIHSKLSLIIKKDGVEKNDNLRFSSVDNSQSESNTSLPSPCNQDGISPGELNSSQRTRVIDVVLSALGTLESPSRQFYKSTNSSVDSDQETTTTQELEDERKEQSSHLDECQTDVDTKQGKRHKKRRQTINFESSGKKHKTHSKTSKPKHARELNNLNCTFLDYQEMFETNSLLTINGKRRCNIIANSKIGNQLDSLEKNSQDLEEIADESSTNSSEQPAKIKRRRQTFCTLDNRLTEDNSNQGPIKVVIRRLSEDGTFGIGTPESPPEPPEPPEPPSISPLRKNAKVVLQRLSPEDIKQATNLLKKKTAKLKENNTPPQTLPPSTPPRVSEEPILVPVSSKPVQPKPRASPKLPKYLNVDPTMTLISTKTCVICSKRPSDLTNHYVVQHRTESYVSRLSASDIKNLETNITLAIPLRKRYKVICVFCQDELEDHFVNFHAHYSFHTGEYGYICDICEIVRPYREDIRSHQYRTSRCRNGKIRTNYLYSADLKVIYLYVCTLCNFVQLNEANIHKHHRDHHGFKFDEQRYVKKCIIAAMNNGEIVNEVMASNGEEYFENAGDENQRLNEQQQEFLHECPLDIKDVQLTQENQMNCTELPQPQPQPVEIVKDELDLSTVIYPENHLLSKDTNQQTIFNQSPETLLEELHASQQSAKPIMTVIHFDKVAKIQDNHKPYVEPVDPADPVDSKPNLAEIKTEVNDTESDPNGPNGIKPIVSTIYRTFNPTISYFGLYKCTLDSCWFSTNTAKNFIEHVTLHLKKKKNFNLNCSYCTYKSSFPKKLVRHVRGKHSMSRYQCSECTYRSITPGNVTFHRELHHAISDVDKCIYVCAGRVRPMEEMIAAMKAKMLENVNSLECPECSSSFYAILSLITHMKEKHPTFYPDFDPNALSELTCIYCKTDLPTRSVAQSHMANQHPDELCYVVLRTIQDASVTDAIENLTMIDISIPTKPVDIHLAPFEDLDIPDDELPSIEESELSPENDDTVTTTTSTQVKSKEDQLLLVRIRPLVELLTENTGVDASTLYQCPQCNASFFTYDLWLNHIKTRHNLIELILCPYCSQSLALNEVHSHFKSHIRHKHICLHCIMTFCSKEEALEHFPKAHKEQNSIVEGKIPIGRETYHMFKKQACHELDWIAELRIFIDILRSRLIEGVYFSTTYQWLNAFTESCADEIDFPLYVDNIGYDKKCLVEGCPFVGVDVSTLDRHLNEHTMPRCYKCPYCTCSLSSPSWEDIKNHIMLHGDVLHACCVCKYIHHQREMITKHNEMLHKCRDVPVLTIRRQGKDNQISLALVLPSGKTNFTTSSMCFCCGMDIKQKPLINTHLRQVHNIRLISKCELCEMVLLTASDAELHKDEHNVETFRMRYDILTLAGYSVVVKSLSPFSIDTIPNSMKRASDTVEYSPQKRLKPDEGSHIQIKDNQILIKTEFEDETDLESEQYKPVGAIKCINIAQLIADKEPAYKVPENVVTQCEFVEHEELNVQSIDQQCSQNTTKTKIPETNQVHLNIQLPNNAGTAIISHALPIPIPTTLPTQSHTSTASTLHSQPSNFVERIRPSSTYVPAIVSAGAPPVVTVTQQPRSTYPGLMLAQSSNKQQPNIQPLVRPTSQISGLLYLNPKVQLTSHASLPPYNTIHNTTAMQSSVQQQAPVTNQFEISQLAMGNHSSIANSTIPRIPQLAPVCQNCKCVCRDFEQFKIHFELLHADKNHRFLFRLVRIVQCTRCMFRGTMEALMVHYRTYHPKNTPTCYAVEDLSRCGICYEAMKKITHPDGEFDFICACPKKTRDIGDCLDTNMLKILQNFGQKAYVFVCTLCRRNFCSKESCSMHIVNSHNRHDIQPESLLIEITTFMCSLCEATMINIKEIIMHMKVNHIPASPVSLPAERLQYYNELSIIYPLGLIVTVRQLRNSDKEGYQRIISIMESNYFTPIANTIIECGLAGNC